MQKPAPLQKQQGGSAKPGTYRSNDLWDGDGMHRAHIHTGAAARTLFIVYTGHVIGHLDGALRAALFALHAADAACRAGLARQGATVVIGAHDNGLFALRPNPDHLFGARLLAGAAACAFFRIHTGKPI